MELKAEGKLKELFTVAGFDKDDIEAIEGAFSRQAQEMRQAEKSTGSKSVMEMARSARIIK